MLCALAIEAVIGWPRAFYVLIGHPTTWLGALIRKLDGWLNLEGTDDHDRRMAGVAAALFVIVLATVLGIGADWLLPPGIPGFVIAAFLAWPLIAARSLHTHVAAVMRPLALGDLDGARAAVGQIVGRDPATLNEAGVARAAIESLAENTSDGVIAPLFWGAIFGLPGIAAYKAINTLDSMIGHKTPRHLAFGWAAARIDDVANYIPARLTGVLFALTSSHAGTALSCMMQDARKHRSPNAGWPEAALAASLGVRLSGPRTYADGPSDEPWVNAGAPDPGPSDIGRALRSYRAVVIAAAAILAVLWLV